MSILRFGFQSVIDELASIEELSKDYVAPASAGVWSRFRRALEGYRNERTERVFDWCITSADPFRTVPEKQYEPGGKGAQKIVGEVTAKWQIKREPHGRNPARHFKLVGIASTRVRLLLPATETNEEQELAMWRMEVADPNAPGCYFHTQIMGQSESPPFPKSIPVPRLPSVLMTPPAVAEFMLAELYQDDWVKNLAKHTKVVQRWAPIQHDRLERILKWKIAQLQKSTGSPWSTLKAAKPDPNLFV